MQLIFKVVHFMIAVIMMQDQLHVATVDELHIEALKKKVKKSIVRCCKRPVFGAFIYLTCFAYDLFFFFSNKAGWVYLPLSLFLSHVNRFSIHGERQQGTITSGLFKLNQ